MRNLDIHNIEFMIRADVSIDVLYRITDEFCCPAVGTDEEGAVFFNICLTKDQAVDFYNLYGWAMLEICDMDQDDGGSYIG